MVVDEQRATQVEVKTKKLKKLWSKYQTAQREIKDIQEEFQQERSDMLDTIRELTRQLKLKEVRLSVVCRIVEDWHVVLVYISIHNGSTVVDLFCRDT